MTSPSPTQKKPSSTCKKLWPTLLAPALLSSCTYIQLLTQQPTITFDETSQSYHFKGPINFGTAQKLKDTVPPDSALLLQSQGGRSEEARAIARWAKTNRIKVTITGACVSSCANYLTAVPGVGWREPVRLLFHGGGTGNYLQPCAVKGECPVDLRGEAKSNFDFGREFNLNMNFVTFSDRASQSIYNQRAAADKSQRLIGVAVPYYWIPTREELKCFGIAAPVQTREQMNIKPENRNVFFTTAELPPQLQEEFRQICPAVGRGTP